MLPCRTRGTTTPPGWSGTRAGRLRPGRVRRRLVAYLADLHVLLARRGSGLGKGLVHHMVEAGPGRDFRRLLHTADALDLYRPFGFGDPDTTLLERPRADPPTDG